MRHKGISGRKVATKAAQGIAGGWLALCASGQAVAQTNLGEIEITVTATRSEVSEKRAPASISVIRGEKLEKAEAGRVGDALKEIPGVFMRGSAYGDLKPGGSVGTITLRGISGSARTLFLVDGIPVNSPLSGTLDYSLLPTLGLSRIEVAPGPFSSLYGSSAVGGVINIITKKPTKREFQITGSLGGDGAGIGGKGALSYRDVIGDGFGIALDAAYAQSNGYADDMAVRAATTAGPGTPVTGATLVPTTSGGTTFILGDRGRRPWWTLNLGARGYYDFSADTKVSFGASYAQSYSGYGNPHSYLRDAAGNPVYTGFVTFTDATGTPRRLNLGGTTANPFLNFVPAGENSFRTFVKGETRIGEVKLKADVSYSFVNAWFTSPVAASTIAAGAGGITYGGPGTYTPGPSNRVLATLSGEVPLPGRNTLVIGAQVQKDWFDRNVSDLSFFRDPDTSTGRISYHSQGEARTLSAFVQNKTDLRDNLSLYLGGRYDHWTTSGQTHQAPTPVQPTLPVFNTRYAERSANAFSPKASLVYLPVESVTLRASVGRAFRTPDLLQLYSRSQTTLTSVTDAAPGLKPERSTSWELGGEWRASQNLKLRATYYENYVSDLIYNRVVSAALTQRINAGEALIRGVEAGADFQFNENWGLFANATWNDSRIRKNDAVPASVGKRVTFSPRWMTNTGLTYTRDAFSAQVSGRYVSKVYADDQNRDIGSGYPGSYDGFFTMDARLSFELREGLKLSLIGSNLLDRRYFQSFLMPGRTITGEVRYKF